MTVELETLQKTCLRTKGTVQYFSYSGILNVGGFEAEVIETNTKPTHPIGELGVDASGKVVKYVDRGRRRRAILAVGRADYGDIDDIVPVLEGAEVAMASGDHTILDIEDCKEQLRVGDIVRLKVKYSALMRLTTSENITIEEINRQ